jgi:NADH-quinone oxidoreductase subunit J
LAVVSLAQADATQLNQLTAVFFYVLGGLTVFSAWAIVFSRNIVRMSVYLLLTLGGAAGMYFMLNAEFIAAIQLIVYAGGTLILIIFGVMLTSKNPFLQLQTALWERFAGPAVGLAVASLLILAMVHTPIVGQSLPADPGYKQVEFIGRALLSRYLVPFEVAGVLLLVVMIGAAYMARRRA